MTQQDKDMPDEMRRRVEIASEARVQRYRHEADAARLKVQEWENAFVNKAESGALADALPQYFRDTLDLRQDRIAVMEAELIRLQREVNRAEAIRKAVGRKYQVLEREIAALRGSTSWRITAPLRVLSRAISRLRGRR